MLEYVLYLKNIILEIENNIKNDDDWVNVRFDNEDLEYIKGIIRELEKVENVGINRRYGKDR